ncbi:hypothetical protein BWI17_21005 [Betaproteobacteria bacterium GR16-43]|nr:hypothetical protein BWI17_21005 [Betaproteobacteria bacterium GR16-43]
MTSSIRAESGTVAPIWRRAFDWWLVQVKHMLPPTIFFAIGFNLILFTRWMTLQEHGIPFTNFFAATLAALLVGKVVLVVDNLPFMRRFDGAPLIQPILFKSAIYWVCVFVFRIAEGLVHFLIDGGALGAFPDFLVAQFSWPRFLAIQIWLMVLFLVYVTAHELDTLFGDGELPRLFLRWHSSEAKLTRRQRIRLLSRLNRLTEANPVEVISEKTSRAHAELVGILRELAARPHEKEIHP